jgi:hypothetical protein
VEISSEHEEMMVACKNAYLKSQQQPLEDTKRQDWKGIQSKEQTGFGRKEINMNE